MANGDMRSFEEMECVNCFVVFGVPFGFIAKRRQDKQSFYCPNGHSMSYRESALDRERRERQRLEQQIAQRDDEIRRQREMREAAERTASARKGQITKLKNRAAAGVCPCCNRTFQNLARHMNSQHPKYRAEEVQ